MLRVEIAGDREHRVVRRVVRLEEVFHVIERRVREIVHRAHERVMERVRWRKGERRQTLPPRAVRLIIDRPAALVLHDITLGVELLLRHRRQHPSHTVGFEEQCDLEPVGGHRLVIVRAVQPGGAVQYSAGALNDLEVLVRADIFRSLEEHVLEQVREAGAAFTLVRGSDVVPQIDGDEWRRVILGEGHE